MFRFIKNIQKTPRSLFPVRSYRSAAGGYYGYKPQNTSNGDGTKTESGKAALEVSKLQRIVQSYRDHGFNCANIDPLGLRKVEEMKSYAAIESLSCSDLQNIEGVLYMKDTKDIPGEVILQHLEGSYCGSLGFEIRHLNSCPGKNWLYKVAEDSSYYNLDKTKKKDICGHLLRSQVMERFLAKKFPSLKRYSGEGAESMFSFMHELFSTCALDGVEDLLISIPHRGRLCLLTGLMNFPPSVLFNKIKGNPEFESKYNFIGDVISHLTSSTDLHYGDKKLHVTMVPNPSHLEASHPVVYGKTRCKQLTKSYGHYGEIENIDKVINIQVHGDAAVSGQGIVMETALLESLPHFDVGGSIHLIVNNQLGFTTPHERATSSNHCSDFGKLYNCPVIHVNGDHPEEVAKSAKIALDYKRLFHKDIIINMHCFRRWGHNEIDDPTLTNPEIYQVIHNRGTVPDMYRKELIDGGVCTENELSAIESEYTNFLEREYKKIETGELYGWEPFKDSWSGITQADTYSTSTWNTGIDTEKLKYVGLKSVDIPENFNIHPHLKKTFCHARQTKLESGTSIDWATAEALAIGTLLSDGHHVRICGQDVGRATFNHRHAMVVDQNTDEIYIPFNNMQQDQKGFLEVVNSPLSEEAVLAYEYGMSIENPNNLYIWEAQFGDFFNGAQIIIDTFISNGEIKWLLQSGLVMLLPHGMDGAGPDHSSCKIERFLQLSDSKEDSFDSDDVNMQIVNPTTPAQYFHLLRRQIVRNFRKPLIVAAPKLILRMSAATSSLEDLSDGTYFHPVLGDAKTNPAEVKKVLFCSGKHYYELDKQRLKHGKTDMAIIRLESLVPFPSEELKQELNKYSNAEEFIWCQEEHRNQGAWSFIYPRFSNLLNTKLSYAGRPILGASAIGVTKWHAKESEDLIKQLFDN